MKKKISELLRDPYSWGLAICGFLAVDLGWLATFLIVATAYLSHKRMERLFEERIKSAVGRGAIRVVEVNQ